MPKNIVICSDGTGNTAIKGRGTNVFKVYEAVDLHGWETDRSLPRQVAFYDDGVGTEGFKPLRLLGGAFGWGLSRNVRQLYAALARVYQPGDRIYLFGFSRGAFTVRTLGGMIAECGVVSLEKCDDREKMNAAVGRAYELHRRHYLTWVQRLLGKRRPKRVAAAAGIVGDESTAVKQFHADHAVEKSVEIEFIGVWDTVDAVGLPFEGASKFWNAYVYCYKFPDYKLSPRVKRAAHALAIDDERRSFHPLIWDEREETGNRIDQVWFSGVHSNVGGGYPKQGISLVTLDWMMSLAEEAGMCFLKSDRDYYREHANVHDNLYDSRSGVAVYYRYKPRDIEVLCKAVGVKPRINISVVERIALATQDYAPGNVPFEAEIVVTDPKAPAAGRLGDWLKPEGERAAHLLNRTRREIGVRRWTHALLIIVTILAVVFGFPEFSSWSEFIKNLVSLATPSGMWELVKNLATRWYALPVLFPLVLLAASRVARTRMRAVYSHWWHSRRNELQDAIEKVKGG